MQDSTRDRIRVALLTTIDGVGSSADRARLHALGWATVELDRAASELAGDLEIAPERFVEAANSVTLGARCRVAAGALPGGRSLVILEPATEGRLAATLARLGEGPAITWFMTDREVEVHASDPRAGPFGPERLVVGAAAYGPHRFLIWPGTGTIAP